MAGLTSSRKLLCVITSLFMAIAGSVLAVPQAGADERPFPKYELTYERIIGQKDPNFDPATDSGDGCIHSPEPQLAPLAFFGITSQPINQCDGIRVHIRWYYTADTVGAPTLKFRFGTTWQYTEVSNPDPDDYQWKPVENFLYDGKPTTLYDAENPVVKDSSGKMVRMHGGDGFYEPIHFVFEDSFGAGVEHTMQYDAYLPATADWGGMTFGTGSTGDTHGGSIGAKANGIVVPITVSMDARYVLDSEYRAARGAGISSTKSSMGTQYAPRRDARWGGDVADSTYTVLSCLEDQQLTALADSVPVNRIYPDLPFTEPVTLTASRGERFFARYPYEFYLRSDPRFHPLRGIRLINHNDATGEFEPFTDANGELLNLPYKPTPESLIADIPGYEYVGFDIPDAERGAYDSWDPDGWPNYKTGPNVTGSINKTNVKTKHFYYTYAPIPGSFELTKVAAGSDTPIEKAMFDLYEIVDDTPTACGVTPDLSNTQTVNICPTESDDPDCRKIVRKVELTDSDGSSIPIVTDAAGRFTAPQRSLAPGEYLLKETSVPAPYVIDHEWNQFTVPIQREEHATQVTVTNQTPPPPETPKPRKPRHLPKTGGPVLGEMVAALLRR